MTDFKSLQRELQHSKEKIEEFYSMPLNDVLMNEYGDTLHSMVMRDADYLSVYCGQMDRVLLRTESLFDRIGNLELYKYEKELAEFERSDL